MQWLEAASNKQVVQLMEAAGCRQGVQWSDAVRSRQEVQWLEAAVEVQEVHWLGATRKMCQQKAMVAVVQLADAAAEEPLGGNSSRRGRGRWAAALGGSNMGAATAVGR